MKNAKTLYLLILLLLGGNIFFGANSFQAQKKFEERQQIVHAQVLNEKVLDFSRMFIYNVLQAEKEVDFEIRLKLENSVRSIGDEDILEQWQKFIASNDEVQAQKEVKNLLSLLLSKIRIAEEK